MSPRTDPTDPTNMTPDERLAEVASILAEGVLRLRKRQAVVASDGPCIHAVESGQSGRIRLEVPSETRLHGQRG